MVEKEWRIKNEIVMIVDIKNKIANLTIIRSLNIGNCEYREVYEAQDINGEKFFLTVYAVDDMPKAMNASPIAEFEYTHKTQNDIFETFVNNDEGVVDGKHIAWMTTRYFDHVTLRDMIEKGEMEHDDKIRLFKEIMVGLKELEYLTDGGGHFGLTPDNVLVSKDEKGEYSFYLVGLEYVASSSTGAPTFDMKTLNMCFRAPETSLGRFTQATMIYSLAMIMAYTFQGSYPFSISEGDDWDDIKMHIRKDAPVLKMEDGMNTVLCKALNPKMNNRYKNIDDFGKAITPVLGIDVPQVFTSGTCIVEETGEIKKGEKGLSAVAGLDDLKKTLRRDFVDIVSHISMAREFAITPPNYLFYGPPGTGKTFISMKLAEECGMECKVVSPADLASIYIHGTQEQIKNVFEEAEKRAKANKKGYIIIFDEFDAFCPKRTGDNEDRQGGEVAEFLTQLNTCTQKNVYCIGTTNCLDRIDKAIVRHGRIDSVVYIGLPDKDARRELFKLELEKRPYDTNLDMERLALLTDKYTGSDITHIVEESARISFEESIHGGNGQIVKIGQKLLEQVIARTRPSVTESELKRYEQTRDEFLNNKGGKQRRIGFNV